MAKTKRELKIMRNFTKNRSGASGAEFALVLPLLLVMLVGAIDVASLDVETPEQVTATLRAALEFVAPERMVACTNCGLAPLPRPVAEGKLEALGKGASLLRIELA